MSHLPPLYSPSAYAQVPTVPAVPVVAPTAPPNLAHNDAHVAASPADYGQPLGGAGVDLGAAFPPTPYTPYAYHGQHADSPHHHPLPLVSPAAPTTHHPQCLASIEHPHIPIPIPMPEPQRPSRAPPLPHRRQESLLQLVPHASVRSPPMTATTQLFMPSPPSANNNNLVSSSHLFEEPVASSQGSASYLVERVPVDDSVNVDSFEQRRVLVPTGRSPPTSSAIIPIASSAASSTSAAAAGSLTRPPATAAVVPSAPTSSSLARPTLPDWAKDPDDDRPPIRPPVFLTLPFILTLLLLLISLAGIVTIRIILPAYVAALADDASPTFLLAYQWLLVASVAYSLAYLALFSSCFYNRHARKVSVSPQRQAWKLSVRRWLLLPIEVGLTVAWLILTLIIGLVKDESALYLTVCTMDDPTGSGLVSARVGVSCTQATTMLVLAGMMASACGISMGQLAWATWKNQQKVNEFKVVEGGEQLGV